MDLVAVKAGSQVYHGSMKLYQISCYIRQNYEELRLYLEKELTPDLEGLDDNFWDKLSLFYAKYKRPLYLPNPVTKEVLYIATVKLLSQIAPTVSVYAIWSQFFTPEDQDSLILLSFASQVEQGQASFDVMFYSTMRLPVQFFSPDYDVSEMYLRTTPEAPVGAIYTYTFTKDTTLLDYDSASTLTELTRTVYASKVPFPLSDLIYYANARIIYDTRYAMMTVSLLSLYNWDQLIQCLDEVCGSKATGSATQRDILLQDDKKHVMRVIAKNWLVFYKEELLTPYHLWRFTTWIPGIRVLSYEGDALLLKVLIEHGGYSGYYSESRHEMAVIRPEDYGVMNTGEIETREGDCPYDNQ